MSTKKSVVNVDAYIADHKLFAFGKFKGTGVLQLFIDEKKVDEKLYRNEGDTFSLEVKVGDIPQDAKEYFVTSGGDILHGGPLPEKVIEFLTATKSLPNSK